MVGRSPIRPYSQSFRDHAVALVASGRSCASVARELKVNCHSVQVWARGAGLVLVRGQGGPAQARAAARVRVWQLTAEGLPVAEIAKRVGHSPNWVRGKQAMLGPMVEVLQRGRVGGATVVASVDRVGNGRVGRGRRMTLEERVAIGLGLADGKSARQIALSLGRSPSSVTREINRGAFPDGSYDARWAHQCAHQRRSRPKPGKLTTHVALRQKVVELLNKRYSPQQISVRLRHDYGDDRQMRVSHETIYQALYVHGGGALRQELKREKGLRSGRQRRIARSALAGTPGRGRKTWVEGASIDLRPHEVDGRLTPGHWEGDLIIGGGKGKHTALITLVERSSRFLLIARLGVSHDSPTVIEKLTQMVQTLPSKAFSSITWDQGSEMAQVAQFKVDTNIKVYFADPHSPWQRPSNERLNRDIREYFPKGTNFADITDEEVAFVQDELNDRARVVLNGMTPRETLAELLKNDASTP